jgi:drug/metabolite transporter (DMT)-like permease
VNGVAVIGALGSALCFAVSSVLQQHGASRAPRGSGLHLDLVGHLVRRPVWLLGMLAAVGTLVLQTLALSQGELVLVQPLLVTGLLFALPLSLLIERRRADLREWVWAAVLVAGLVAFLVGARPLSGPLLPDDERLWQFGVGAVVLAGAVALLAGLAGRRHRPVLLGAAAGLLFGVAAGLIKYCCALVATDGLGWVATSWPPYALVVVGAAGIVLNQAAYQSGPLSGALPALAICEPLTAVVFGLAVFGERIEVNTGCVLAAGTGFLVMAVAVTRLSLLCPRQESNLWPTP